MLHSKRLLSNDKCHAFEVTKEMHKRMNSDIYKKTSQQNTTADSSNDDDDDDDEADDQYCEA